MQTYLNQVGITPTGVKFHLTNCHFAAISKGVCITPARGILPASIII